MKYNFISLLFCTALAYFSWGCSNDDYDDPFGGNASVSGSFNGHDYVDLGLSIKWATMNLGAYNPWENGSFYKWSHDGSYNILNICGTKNDNATHQWGGDWRTPTLWEAKELIDNCTWKVITMNGNKGCLGTGPNGNTIFFPYAGKYWADDDETYNVGESGSYWTSIIMPEGEVPFSAFGSAVHKNERSSWDMAFTDDMITIYVSNVSPDLMKTVRPVFGTINSGNGGDDNGYGGGGNGGSSNSDLYFTNFNFTATKTSISVKFYVNERPTSGTIYYGTSSASKSLSTTVAGKQLSAKASGLKAGTKYYFKCVAKTSSGSITSEEYPAMTEY